MTSRDVVWALAVAGRMKWSWLWMRRFVRMAAGILRGSVFHEFDAGGGGIVDVPRPFAVAADLGFIVRPHLQTVLLQPLERRPDVRHAQRKSSLHAAFFALGVRANVEHGFDPVGAVGDLEFFPFYVV